MLRPLFAVLLLATLGSCASPEPADYDSFVHDILSSIAAGEDLARLDRTFDWAAAQAKPYYGRYLTEREQYEYRIQALDQMRLSKVLSGMLQGGQAEVTRQYDVEGQHFVVLRILNDEGFRYVELALQQRDGKLRIADFYDYTTGEWYTMSLYHFMQTLRYLRQTVRTHGQQSPARAARIFMEEMEQAIADRDYEVAMRYYRRLPPELRRSSSVHTYKVRIAAAMSDAAYVDALIDHLRYHPESERFRLLHQFHAYSATGELQRARQQLYQLSKYVGADYYLTYLEAETYQQSADLAAALTLYTEVQERRPDFIDAHLAEVTLHLQDGSYQAATRKLSEVEQLFDLPKAELEALFYDYPDFFASTAYSNWRTGAVVQDI